MGACHDAIPRAAISSSFAGGRGSEQMVGSTAVATRPWRHETHGWFRKNPASTPVRYPAELQ
jgi:hypothetical protein